jgi:hypothetical protein
MKELIRTFKNHVKEASVATDFVHNKWFVQWHLEIVEAISFELLEYYPEADKYLVEVMVWLHDYGKIIDFDNQYQATQTLGRKKLIEIGFDREFVDVAISNIDILDKKMTVDISQSPIEVQIVSSADGCSHMVGPFMQLWWYENHEKQYEDLMEDNLKKVEKDWNRKIVLPEARNAFTSRYRHLLEQSGKLPSKYIEK